MKRGYNARKGVKGFQRTINKPSSPTLSPSSVSSNKPSTVNGEPTRQYNKAYETFQQHTGQESSGSVNACKLCGRFTAVNGDHECVAVMGGGKQFVSYTFPAVGAVGVYSTAAAVVALSSGYIIPVALVAVGLVVLGVKKFFTSRVSKDDLKEASDNKWREAGGKKYKKLQAVQSQVNDIQEKMGVEGDIIVMYSASRAAVNRDHPNAAAGWVRPGVGIIKINEGALDLSSEQMEGVIAHEVAHLQKPNAARARLFFKKAALPAGLTAGVASGLAVLPAAGLAVAVWYSSKMASAAMSRREERRADREAYRVTGEKFEDALRAMHMKSPQVRSSLPWRAEDVVFSHPNLPNRLADMKK